MLTKMLQGSWGGRGTKKQAPRPNLVKKIAGVDVSKRADAGKKNVIISEKKDKKAAKYLVKDLPHPYTSREQFARSMATPIGTEWNTRVAHQRATLPRVVKKVRLYRLSEKAEPFTIFLRYRWELLSIPWRNCFENATIQSVLYFIQVLWSFITGFRI
jgi:hypothetical protein